MSNLNGLYSDGSICFAEPMEQNGERQLKVSFRVVAPSEIKKAWVRYAPDGEGEYKLMKKYNGGTFERWEAKLPLRWKKLGYRFEFLTDHGLMYLNQQGLNTLAPNDNCDFVHLDEELPVSWLPGSTFYQIFPDRFFPGDKSRWDELESYTYAGKSPTLRPWGEEPRGHESGGHIDFYGGDLKGIKEKLAYLTEMGIGGIYLNPIFHAPSNHRYDTQDFRKVDPRLGTNEDFAELVDALHEKDMRVILDAVFNHVGCGHRWFNKEGFYKEDGAYQNPQDSPYSEYFIFHDGQRDHYDCWLGVKSLPKLDFRSEKLRDEIYAGDDSIGKMWLKPPYNADGWRFDVANMLGRNGKIQIQKEIWKEMREHLKDTKEEVYLMGEHFFDPADLLDGEQLDGVMNYHGFYFPVLRWLTQKEHQTPRDYKGTIPIQFTAEDLSAQMMTAMARVPFKIAQGQFNIIGSHDTTRILSRLEGNKKHLKIAALMLMTWPGIPCIYYGDEIGLKGIGDPACRGCMPWDDKEWDKEIRDWFIELIQQKTHNEALAKGGVMPLHAHNDTFVYGRIHGDEACLIATNRSNKEKTITIDLRPLGVTEQKLNSPLSKTTLEPKDGQIELQIPAESADLYVM